MFKNICFPSMMREGERAEKKKKKGKVFVLIDCEDGCFFLLILLYLI